MRWLGVVLLVAAGFCCAVVLGGLGVLSFPKNGADSAAAESASASADSTRPAPNSSEAIDDLKQQIAAVGYLGGYEKAGERSGLLLHDHANAYQGLNFYTTGHAPEAHLIDMDGGVLHSWRYELADVWPQSAALVDDPPNWWRRGHVYPNGDVLAIFERLGLIKLDKDSQLLWSFSGGCHHDLDVTSDGRIFVLSHRFVEHPTLRKGESIIDDLITVLNADGEELRQVSVLNALANSEYSGVPYRSRAPVDILHTNTLEVLDGRLESQLPAFKRGNILVSFLHADTIAVVDMEAEKVVWALSGMWQRQHQPTVLDNGNLLLFDNRGHNLRAKVIEFDPATQELIWSYKGTAGSGFESYRQGSNQRLPNGNTLITDSVNGRAFEVTQDGTIVWEFVNPARYGKSNELVAVLCEMIRLDPQFPVDWIPPRVD